MVELKDSGPESTGRRAANVQLLSPSIGAPLKEARRGNRRQRPLDDNGSDEPQVSVLSPRSERTDSAHGESIDLEHEWPNERLECNRCEIPSASGNKSSASNDNFEPQRDDRTVQSEADDPARGKMRSDEHWRDVAEQQNQPVENERRLRPQKYCSVCGDKAIACNFNAVTCESCKAFFRRNAFKEQQLRCLFENRCAIDRVTRRFCSKCRLLKCLSIGMKREWILTEEQKQIKRVKIMQNKRSRQQQVSTTQLAANGNSSGSDESSGVGERLAQAGEPLQTDIPPGGRKVDTRDASVSCPDEGDFAAGLIQAQCTFAHQCRFCSLRLGAGCSGSRSPFATAGANHADHLHFRPHLHQIGHHQDQLDQQLQQALPYHGQPHYHYPQQAADVAYGHQLHFFHQTQARPQSRAQLAVGWGPCYTQANPASVATVHRAGNPELVQHHFEAHASCTGVVSNGDGSQSRLEVAPGATGSRECCCSSVTSKLRAPSCHTEPATSTTNAGSGAGGQLPERQERIRASMPHLHMLSHLAESSSLVSFGPAQNDCGGKWPRVASELGDRLAAASCADQGENCVSTQCDTEASESVQPAGNCTQAIKSGSHVEWRGELFVEPAFSEQETWERIEQLELAHSERALILEMIAATKQILDIVEKPSNDSALDDIIFCLDEGLKSLIQSVKKIGTFRILSMDDQIVLLKNACFKILLIRSCLFYNDQIEGWIDRCGHMRYLRVLKTDNCNSYERHKELIDKLARPMRRDRLIIMFLIMVVLFDPATAGLKNTNSVELDNLVYLSALRKYLLATQPEPLAKYERLVEALRVLNVCNEEYNLFFSRKYQPEQITPLLIEIFDISVNSPAR